MKTEKTWNSKTLREKTGILLSALVLLGCVVLYLLYFARILDHNAKTFAWTIYPFHFFTLSFGLWNVNRKEAKRQLFLGGFVSIFSLLGLWAFFLAYF